MSIICSISVSLWTINTIFSQGVISPLHFSTTIQIVHVFTKALGQQQFNSLIFKLGISALHGPPWGGLTTDSQIIYWFSSYSCILDLCFIVNHVYNAALWISSVELASLLLFLWMKNIENAILNLMNTDSLRGTNTNSYQNLWRIILWIQKYISFDAGFKHILASWGLYVFSSNSQILHADCGTSPNVGNAEAAELNAFHKALTYAQQATFVSCCFLAHRLNLVNCMLGNNDCILRQNLSPCF